ncbi:phospholipid-transporting ATPase ABCA3-like [Haemaphysalis longicornis]
MITGFVDCSTGKVLVGGYDINVCTRDARESTGYCPQNNILFDELTVEQHAMFFAIVKGIPRSKVCGELDSLLSDLDLNRHRKRIVSTLSVGQQRRLSALLAVIGSPKVIVMDEPTANMDPDERRSMWELLLEVRRGRTILLTTQYLEEADVLGDRIAVMANGQIRCLGSPTFLKNRFGSGYHLLINKLPGCKTRAIEKLLRKHSPKVKLRSDKGSEAVFILGQMFSSRHIIAMFKELEDSSAGLHIESVGVSMTSLEDVLVRVGEEHHVHHHVSKFKTGYSEGSTFSPDDAVIRMLARTTASEPSWHSRVRAVMVKRAIHVCREKKMVLFSWVMPPLLLSLLFFLEYLAVMGSGGAVEHTGDTLNYFFSDVVELAMGFEQIDTEQFFVDEHLEPIFAKNYFDVKAWDTGVNIMTRLLDMGRETLRTYVFHTHFGVQITKKTG